MSWDYLLPVDAGTGGVHFARRLIAPPGATQLTVRATLRWTAAGQSVWTRPSVIVSDNPIPQPAPVRISVVTGTNSERLNREFKSVSENVEFYGHHCEAACRRDRPSLILLPETALQWGLRGHPLDVAVTAAGPEMAELAAIARHHRVRIGVGLFEREGDAVYNSLVLLSPLGEVEGRYRKVHLAQGEDMTGCCRATSSRCSPRSSEDSAATFAWIAWHRNRPGWLA